MPFTPYHFGPSTTVAFALRKYLDIPIFIFVNLVIDLEPLAVMVFRFSYPLHGFFHTIIGGTILGSLLGSFAYIIINILYKIFSKFNFNYHLKLSTSIYSGIVGLWFHIFLDSIMHADIKPFFPSSYNPFHQLISTSTLYLISTLLFLPAIAFIVIYARQHKFINQKNPNQTHRKV